jgi:hypothetical protein
MKELNDDEIRKDPNIHFGHRFSIVSVHGFNMEGTEHTATCTICGNAVNSMIITGNGSGYTTPPTFVFTPLNTSVVGESCVGGTLYCVPPTISFIGGGGGSYGYLYF